MAFLEAFANSSGQVPCPSVSTTHQVTWFDFVNLKDSTSLTISMLYIEEQFWKDVNGVWGPRVTTFMKDIWENPTAFVLLESQFIVNERESSFVLAKLEYNPDKDDKSRFSVASSLTRIG